jgi:chaperonin GroEL
LPRRRLPRQKPDFQKPGVVFQPRTTLGIQHGVNQLLNAIRPTLGPLPRLVAIQPTQADKPPELLDSGGIIARRIIQVPERDQDVGLMFARHMLWKLQEKTGDGTATAAVLFQEILNHGIRYKLAGGNAMRLGTFLQEGLKLILSELERQVTPLWGREQLTGLAETICYDAELADHLGQVFETIGSFGRLEVRTGRSREVNHEYVQGVYWEGSPFSQDMILDKVEVRTVLHDGAVLATDLEVNEPEETIELLQTSLSTGITNLLLIVSALPEKTLAPLLNPHNRERIKVVAVKTPGAGMEEQVTNLLDLAMITGGRPLLKATHARLQDARAEDFGYARRIWLYKDTFGITTGKGDPQALRNHVQRLQEAYRQAADADEAKKLLQRLGHLINGSATLWIGALTEDEYKRRKETAQHTANALRMALVEGVLPGGGVALLACLPAIEQRIQQSTDNEAVAAYRILARALQEPFRALLSNAGLEPGQILANLEGISQGRGLDLRSMQIVDMRSAGIIDPASVTKEAVRSAISSAALLLTTDVLVHKRNPVEALQTA